MRYGIVLSLFILFLPFTAVANSEPINSQGSPFIVRVKDRLLTVRARDIPIKRVLKEIADRTSINIVLFDQLEKNISVDFYEIPLDIGLKRLIRDMDHAFIYFKPKKAALEPEIGEIIIYPDAMRGKDSGSLIIASRRQNPKEIKEAVIESLLRALEDEYPVAREQTIAILSQYSDERVFIHLTEVMLNDEDEDVRAGAAKALGYLGDEKAIDPLIIALGDREDWVKENVATALGRIGGERVIPHLMDVQKDESKDVRSAAKNAVKKIRERLGISAIE